MADIANWTGTQAGRVAASAGAAASIPGIHTPIASSVGAGATAINFASTLIEQIVRPNVGQLAVDTGIGAIGEGVARIPGYGPLISPVINEIGEAFKNSQTGTQIINNINESKK